MGCSWSVPGAVTGSLVRGPVTSTSRLATDTRAGYNIPRYVHVHEGPGPKWSNVLDLVVAVSAYANQKWGGCVSVSFQNESPGFYSPLCTYMVSDQNAPVLPLLQGQLIAARGLRSRVRLCAAVTWADETSVFSLQPSHSFDVDWWQHGWTSRRRSTKDRRSAVEGNSDT